MKKGKNIVLVHGWGASVRKLAPLGKELEKLGWKVFIPKLPGFDLKAPTAIWGNQEYMEFVSDKADKYFGNSNYYVFGHSFGGGLAIKLARQKGKKIKGIILCATRGISRANVIKRISFYILAKCGKLLLIFPLLARNFKKVLYKLAREHDYEKTKGVMRGTFKKVISEDLKSELKLIKIPALVLWGSEDKITPLKDAKYIQSKIKSSELKIYKGQKHALPYNKPQALAKDINIWQNHLK